MLINATAGRVRVKARMKAERMLEWQKVVSRLSGEIECWQVVNAQQLQLVAG